MQLAFTFHPFIHSPSGSQHGSGSSAGRPSDALPQFSPHKPRDTTEGPAEPALQSPSADDTLGPLGRSFMNLAMSHISPSKASVASKALDDHAYLKLGTSHEGSAGVSDSPVAQTTASGQIHSPSPGQPSSSVVTPSPQRRNFYPEEASDDESDVPSQHSRRASAAGEPGSALPAEFRCQPPLNANAASSGDTVDTASYTSQEVYHAYRLRDDNGHQVSASGVPQYGAYSTHAKPPAQGHELQPQVPAWRLMGTSPLLEGQQHAQEEQWQQQQQQQQQQAQMSKHEQQQGYTQQPQVPQWQLLGTSPLHEAQMQQLGEPQAQQVHAGQQYQPPRQGYSPQAQGQGSLQQAQGQDHQLSQRAKWQNFMGAPAGHMPNGFGSSTSQSFTSPGRGSTERPLSYASLAVGSWSDGVSHGGSFTKPAASQVNFGSLCVS